MTSNRSLDPGRLAARMLDLPPSESEVRRPALIEMVKGDLMDQWRRGRPVVLESYLEAVPELGTPEAVPIELILAEYEARSRTGAPTDLAQFVQRFPRQAEAFRRLIDQRARADASSPPGGDAGAVDTPVRPDSGSTRPSQRVPIKLPRQLGRYRILRRLGRGAMGAVYLARDTELDRRVALKIPHFRSGEGATASGRHDDLERFAREARAAATLDHPNICPVYDVGQIGPVHYLALAYIKGRPLAEVIRPERPMSPRWVAAFVRRLATAMATAHDRGIIHRDLKPANIMVCAGGQPMIMDFGLAWRLDHRTAHERLTRAGLVLGTPAYMSPEQLSGREEDLGPGCDIYSLGVILYELLTGCRPFDGPEAVVIGQILFVEPERPSHLRPDLDPRLEAVCLKAMARRPEDRYATMGELAAALGEYLSQRPPALRSSAPPGPPVSPAAGASDEPARPPESGPGDSPPTDESRGGPVAVATPAPLRQTWSAWTTIVESHALRRRGRYHADRQAFDALRARLLASIRSQMATASGPERDFYRELEELVLPWLSLWSLARQDEEIRGSVLARCYEVERRLGGVRQPSGTSGGARLLALLALAGASAALLYWGWLWIVG